MAKKDGAARDRDTTADDLQRAADEAAERGFVGMQTDPNPNDAYALTTGPDSPSHVGGPHERAPQPVLMNDPGGDAEVVTYRDEPPEA